MNAFPPGPLPGGGGSVSMFLIGLLTGSSVGTCLGVLILGLLIAMRNEHRAAGIDPATTESSAPQRAYNASLETLRPVVEVAEYSREVRHGKDELPMDIPDASLRLASAPVALRIKARPANDPRSKSTRSPTG